MSQSVRFLIRRAEQGDMRCEVFAELPCDIEFKPQPSADNALCFNVAFRPDANAIVSDCHVDEGSVDIDADARRDMDDGNLTVDEASLIDGSGVDHVVLPKVKDYALAARQQNITEISGYRHPLSNELASDAPHHPEQARAS